jgi:hypothetical protein
LIEALHAFGFRPNWKQIISLLLSSSSSRVLLNGLPCQPFPHRRGLRQGDPLAPLLFILALEPLHRILVKAKQNGLLSQFSKQHGRLRAIFYADNVALFLNPVKEEVQTIFQLLDFFGQTSGLKINCAKCTFFPIQCDDLEMR